MRGQKKMNEVEVECVNKNVRRMSRVEFWVAV